MGLTTNTAWFIATMVADAFIVRNSQVPLLTYSLLICSYIGVPHIRRMEPQHLHHHLTDDVIPCEFRFVVIIGAMEFITHRDVSGFFFRLGGIIWLIVSMVRFDPSRPFFVSEIVKSVNAFIYLTLFTNLTCTRTLPLLQLSNATERY
jgi:hypothetical protein